MIVTNNERFTLTLYKRVLNSPYEWEKQPTITFKGRPASQKEIKQYRIQQGANGNSDSIFVTASNLPKNIAPNDKVVFMGKEWTVMSTGYYFDEARFVNAGLFSNEYIESRCPKGLNLQ